MVIENLILVVLSVAVRFEVAALGLCCIVCIALWGRPFLAEPDEVCSMYKLDPAFGLCLCL